VVEEYAKRETSVKQVASRADFNGLHGVLCQKIELSRIEGVPDLFWFQE
jgi:hypothetical protein